MLFLFPKLSKGERNFTDIKRGAEFHCSILGQNMAVFRWTGIGTGGETIQGELEAATREAVIVRLRGHRIRLLPDRIREKGTGLSREIKIPGLGEKVKAKDVMIFTRQLATMIDARLPIVQG